MDASPDVEKHGATISCKECWPRSSHRYRFLTQGRPYVILINVKTLESKVCKECQVLKNPNEYYVGTQRGKEGQVWKYLDSLCKTCRKAYTHKRRKDTKLLIIEYLGGKCADCNLVDIPNVYDCHHLDASGKDFAPGERAGRSFESMREELDKCVLLCANCHRKRHA